jgi:glycosyltransferase involved in cell wall biosynthesis
MTGALPQITTLIPTYRRPAMLRRAIRSALNQTYRDIRVQVVDNASGDETAAVVADMAREDSRVAYHCHAENIGMINNFNFALQQVQTPYFSFLCDDDLLLPDFYAAALAGLHKYPEALFSAGTCVALSEEGGARMGARMPREGYYAPPDGLLEWRLMNHPYITGSLLRREVVERFGLMNDLMTSDLDLEMRIVAQAAYVISFQPYAIIVSHAANCTRLAAPEVWWHSYETVTRNLETIAALPADLRARVQSNLLQDFADHTYRLGLLSAVRGDFAYAEAAVNALRLRYGQEKPAALLERNLRLQRRVRPIRFCTEMAYRARKALYELKNRDLDRQYRGYLAATGSG